MTPLRDEYIAIGKVVSQKNFELLSCDDFVNVVSRHMHSKPNVKRLKEIWYDLARESGAHQTNWW